MFSYLVYSRVIVVYIRVWKTFPRLLYLDERCVLTNFEANPQNLFHLSRHYENMPMQYTKIFQVVKIENSQMRNFDSFRIFAQNIDYGYTLEPPP